MQPLNDELKLGAFVLPGDHISALPLEQTKVAGKITGPVAQVSVEQRFSNPFKQAVELEYLFPLPHEAAIVDYRITIGNRTIHAELKELRSAREDYQDAVDTGRRASLLEQRRPNLFSVRVGNVQPGEHIMSLLSYEERLHFSDDSYQFGFPMGITPKYHADPTEAVSVDAPVVGPSERIASVELTLEVDAGIPVEEPISPSHRFASARRDSQRFSLNLTTLPNKDFVLRYSVASKQVASALWISKGDVSDTCLVTILPPRLASDFAPSPREFIFVLDRSGSMSNAPIAQARNALKACLRTLSAQDTFAIQAFDDQIEWFAPTVQPVNQSNVDEADHWMGGIEGRGGTEIVPAIEAALALPIDASRQRYLVFLTDGAVSAEQEAYEQIKQKRGTARIFTFGIGPSVNRALLVKMAQLGRGKAEFIQLNEDLESAITRFAVRVSYPVLHDLQLDWRDAQVWDTYPSRLPDLYGGEPLEFVTKIKLKASGEAILSGIRDGKELKLPITLPTPSESNTTIERIWARSRVEALQDDASQSAETKRQQIITLALQHRLLTAFTAFVAIDSEVASDKPPQFVQIAQPLPEQVDFGQPRMVLFSLGSAASQPVPSVKVSMAGRAQYQQDAEMDNTPIESLDLGVRTFNALKRTGITTVGEVLEMLDRGPDAMLAIRNFGEKTLDSLVDNLRNKGYLPPGAASSVAHLGEDKHVDMTIHERLKALARSQNISGSWGHGASEVEMTSVALLAFVLAGHTLRSGDYRRQLQKAVIWLKQRPVTGFDAFIRWRALTELQHAEQNVEQYVSEALSTPVTDSECAAMGQRVAVPGTIETLDDLRIVGLAVGEASLSDKALANLDRDLASTWLAVAKPLPTV